MAALLAFFVLAGPAAAMVAGSVADHDMLGQVRAEQSWHPVRATLTHPGARRLQASASNWVVQSAEASWTAGGRTHTGWIPLAAPPGQARTASVWVNSAGTPTGPPSAYANLHLVIGLAALCAVLIVAGILFLAAVATRFVLNRRRMSGWDTAWRAIGPQWTRQL